MNDHRFAWIVALLGGAYVAYFLWTVLPPFAAHPDLWGAYAAGFVNPYAAAYSMDAVMCWCLLAAWVWHEAHARQVRHGWVALLIGILPGTAAGFAVYLLLRARSLSPTR